MTACKKTRGCQHTIQLINGLILLLSLHPLISIPSNFGLLRAGSTGCCALIIIVGEEHESFKAQRVD